MSRSRAYITCMQSTYDFGTIPNDELLRRLAALLASCRHTEADLVAHIGEVDARRLYVWQATPSMFVYCTERLHLSEAEACLRIAVARTSREHPVLLEMLADGRLHLSAIAKLTPHLTPENRDELLRRATHRSKREIDELVAELAPRPDVPASVRKLPAGRFVARPASKRPDVGGAMPSSPSFELRPERVDSGRSDVLSGAGTAPTANDGMAPRSNLEPSPALGRPQEGAAPRDSTARCDSEARSHSEPRSDVGLTWAAARPPRPAVIEPLAPARYKVQFTASAELRDKLERLQALMRSSVRDGDLAAVIEAAVTEKLERLEARRFGRTKSPRKSVSASDTTLRTRRVPAAAKRAVDERDEGRCRYVDAEGRRCTARVWVQLHHRIPWAVGGDHSPDNLSLLCSAHNRLMAQIDYGTKAIGKHRRSSATSPATQMKVETG